MYGPSVSFAIPELQPDSEIFMRNSGILTNTHYHIYIKIPTERSLDMHLFLVACGASYCLMLTLGFSEISARSEVTMLCKVLHPEWPVTISAEAADGENLPVEVRGRIYQPQT